MRIIDKSVMYLLDIFDEDEIEEENKGLCFRKKVIWELLDFLIGLQECFGTIRFKKYIRRFYINKALENKKKMGVANAKS